MKKSFIAILLCLCMALTLLPVTAAAENSTLQLSDEAVYGLVHGYSFIDAEESDWDKDLTREQAAKLLAYLKQGEDAADSYPAVISSFGDVADDRDTLCYIEYCVDRGLMSDVGDNKFDPEGWVNGYQLAKWLLICLGSTRDYSGADWKTLVASDDSDIGILDELPLMKLESAISVRDAARMLVKAGQAELKYPLKGTLFEKIHLVIADNKPLDFQIFEDKPDPYDGNRYNNAFSEKEGDVSLYYYSYPGLIVSGNNSYILAENTATLSVNVRRTDGIAPPVCTYAWYEGEPTEAEILDEKTNPLTKIGESATLTVDGAGLSSGAHKYTVYVTADGFCPVLKVMTVTVGTLAVINGDIELTAPTNDGEPYAGDVDATIGGSPVHIDATFYAIEDDADENAAARPSVGLGFDFDSDGTSDVDVEVAPDGGGDARLTVRRTVEESSANIDSIAAKYMLSAIDTAPAVTGAVLYAANVIESDALEYCSGASVPRVVFDAQRSGGQATEIMVTMHASLVSGIAARGGSIGAETDVNSISLAADTLDELAVDHPGETITIGARQDLNIGVGDFSGIEDSAIVPGTGTQLTLQADGYDVSPTDAGVTVSFGVSADVYNDPCAAAAHESSNGGGTETELIPLNADSAVAVREPPAEYFHKNADGEWVVNGTNRGLISAGGYIYCADADGRLLRGWVQYTDRGFVNVDVSRSASGCRYFKSDYTAAAGIARIGGDLYYFDQSGIVSPNGLSIIGYYSYVSYGGSRYIMGEDGRLKTGLQTPPIFTTVDRGDWTDYIGNFARMDGTLLQGERNVDGVSYRFDELDYRLYDENKHYPDEADEPLLVYVELHSCSPAALVLASWADNTDTGWYTGHEEDEKFTLTTPQQLAGLAALVNGGTTNFADKLITLGADMSLYGAGWTPIGTKDNPFKGVFNGDGYEVSGLFIDAVITSELYAGLFGNVEDAAIVNTAVSGSISVTGEAKNVWAGGIAGLADRTHIEGCRADVDITVSAEDDSSSAAGGIVGAMFGEPLKTIVSCSSSGDVSLSSANMAFAGGIAGLVQGDTVRNSFNTGSVSASGFEAYAGGVVGDMTGNSGAPAGIMNCYNRGAVSATGTTGNSGGICAHNYGGSILNSYSLAGEATEAEYADGDGLASSPAASELKTLTSALNVWVDAENAKQDNIDARISYKTWYTSTVYNDGYPCFEQYIPPAPSNRVPVLIDGVSYKIGTKKMDGGVTIVTVDQTQLQRRLANASESVAVPISADTDAVAARLTVKNVEDMAEKGMTLLVSTDGVSYEIPAGAIDTAKLLAALGAENSADVPLYITIERPGEDSVTLQNSELKLPPLAFTVSAEYGGKALEVETFERYVCRVIELPDGVDRTGITTAVVVENGGERHVPTEVFEKDGRGYARINSLTDSVYALIYNEAAFTDAAGKWYEAVVGEMASRRVIDGRGEGVFDGDAPIIRAEFAAILVRALGLPENGDASGFADVAGDAWYSGAVGQAYAYGLVDGKGEGIFDPEANITREEAMAMVRRAAGITALAGSVGSLEAFSDADGISAWALDDARWNVGTGLILGDSAGMLRGRENITRGESAAVILRLLQLSGLVDVRAEA